MDKIIFLTGASGFIGSSFLRLVLAQGYRVRALTRDSAQRATQKGLEWIEADLVNENDWKDAFFEVDVVVHAAAEIRDEALMQRVNVDASLRLLNAAIDSGVQRWVQLSSVGAYGPVQEGVVTEDWPDRPADPYEIAKADFDEELRRAARNSSIEVCIVRPSNVYGAGMRNQSIHQMTNSILKGLFAFLGRTGASANYVHVNDVVRALELCASHPRAANQTYIVSAWAPMEDMASGLADGLEVKPPSRRINLRLASSLAFLLQRWSDWPLTQSRVRAMSLRSRYSTKKIETELGWRVSVTVRDGMKQFAKAEAT